MQALLNFLHVEGDADLAQRDLVAEIAFRITL